MLKKVLFLLTGVVLIVVAGFMVFVYSSYDKDYSAQYPVSNLNVKSDSAMIERGRYLAQGPAHCIDCHSPMEKVLAHDSDEDLEMTGGFGLEIPPGKFYGPNITPDEETGIGKYTDGQLYRMLRYNIRPDGQATIDFMPFFNMSDEDIYAIIAYLRSLEKVRHKMPERELSFLGKALFTFGAIKPSVPDEPVINRAMEDTSIAYGKYLAYAVANCMGCHTERDLQTGEYIGEPYAGGMTFGPDALHQGWVYVTPNITPDKQTGIMANWDEATFIDRMKAGKIYETSPMPWTAYQRMKDNDLKAIYRFLKTVRPVAKTIEEIAIPPEGN
jgi:mono/diheme cytochrome c family protein